MRIVLRGSLYPFQPSPFRRQNASAENISKKARQDEDIACMCVCVCGGEAELTIPVRVLY